MLKEIKEGKTRLLATEKGSLGRTEKGREKKAPVFYNPRMKLNRDVCCAFARTLEDITFADVLAGSGAKGVRVAVEAGHRVHLNDGSRHAFDLIKKNAKLNKARVEVSNEDANLFLAKRKFDFIDIDPFGTPVPFLDSAVQSCEKNGCLGVTATDTAPLCGVYPKACFRKYGAKPLRCEFCHEVGLRILLGHVARTAAKYRRGVKCLLSHSTEHYFRLYVSLSGGKKRADASLSEIGYLYYCRKCLHREHERGFLPEERTCACGSRLEVAGPLWLGRIKDNAVVKKVIGESYYLKSPPMEKMLNTILEEIDEPFYYDIHGICRSKKISAPPLAGIIGVLKERGFKVSRTHFSPTGVKTDAPLNVDLPLIVG